MNGYSFISYARKDQDFAFKLADKLKGYGQDIWIDRKGIKPGDAWRMTIENALRDSQNMILILSKSSLASSWVQHEGSMAYALQKPIFPIMIEKVSARKLPVWINQYQYINFIELNFEDGFRQLVGAINPPDPTEQIIEQIVNYKKRMVLIIGRFSGGRKEILDMLKNTIRTYDLLPINMDFAQPQTRDILEITKALAGMSLFIIADLTPSKSFPLELEETVRDFQIPFVPIIQSDEMPNASFLNIASKYDWVLDPVEFDKKEDLVQVFKIAIIDRALERQKALNNKTPPRIVSLKDFLEKKI